MAAIPWLIELLIGLKKSEDTAILLLSGSLSGSKDTSNSCGTPRMIKTYGSTENMENIPISMSSLKCHPKSSAWWLTYPSEKYESVQVSWDDDIPKIWKNHPFMFQSPPTSHTFPPSAFLSRHQISWGSPPWPPFGASTWSNHGNMDPINIPQSC